MALVTESGVTRIGVTWCREGGWKGWEEQAGRGQKQPEKMVVLLSFCPNSNAFGFCQNQENLVTSSTIWINGL